jgi:hypothetical protein
LAIITMQMMQKIRLTQRVDSDARADAIDPEAVAIDSSPRFSVENQMTVYFFCATSLRFEMKSSDAYLFTDIPL